MVQDIINSLVKEVKTSENIRSTPMGTFQQQTDQQAEQQQYQQQQQQYQQYQQQQQQYEQQQLQYQQYQQQQYQQQQYEQQQQYNQTPQPKKTLYEEWVNYEDAKKVIVVAFIALVLLYPYDTSSLYNKFESLSKFHQYDIFIRFVLLAVILYVLLRKFAYLLDI
jgi:cation transport ATPase